MSDQTLPVSNGINPDFVSPDGYDLCVNVRCKAKTPYKTTFPIEARFWYVEGMGQYCRNCCPSELKPQQEVVPPSW
ncbi:MAG: hypothetical protein AAB552_02975 [Patescibacteria group bacterium]